MNSRGFGAPATRTLSALQVAQVGGLVVVEEDKVEIAGTEQFRRAGCLDPPHSCQRVCQ
jgi:hypothetical protein